MSSCTPGKSRRASLQSNATSSPPPLRHPGAHPPRMSRTTVSTPGRRRDAARPSAVVEASPTSMAPPLQQQQAIFVLSADGSKLFLLDPSSPKRTEDPPAYHTIASPPSAHARILHSADGQPVAPDGADDGYVGGEEPSGEAGPSTGASPTRTTSLRSFHINDLPTLGSSASLLLPHRGSTVSLDQSISRPAGSRARHHIGARTRASTMSGGNGDGALVTDGRRWASTATTANRSRRTRPRIAHSHSTPPHSAPTTYDPSFPTSRPEHEGTPLLGSNHFVATRRGTLRSIFCGETQGDGDDPRGMSWGAGWKRYWSTVRQKESWRCLVHLLILNFPLVRGRSCLAPL